MIETLIELLKAHWLEIATALASAGIGWFFGHRKARQAWRKKEFLDRLNVSLNTLHDGKLLIRTLLEKRCEDIFLNKVASETVLKAAGQTTSSDSLLPLPPADYWYYLNAVLNEISEKFADGLLRRDLGIPVRGETYLVCITCECAGAMRTRKLRAMLVQKRVLQQLPAEPPRFEREEHSTRWQTLRQLATSYASQPERFLELELCA
ncbi:MAG: hypothetical protein R3B90_00950 [Planctomycetaceae bacterium]